MGAHKLAGTHKVSGLVTAINRNTEGRHTAKILLKKGSMICMGRENSYAWHRLGPESVEMQQMLR